MKKNITKIVAVGLSAILFTSCATVFRGVNPHKTISIKGTPEKANVIIDGKLIGQTPLNYEIKNRKTKFVQISKDNFEDQNTSIETKLNPTWTAISILAAVPLMCIPTAIDFTNGSLRTIKTTEISYELKPIVKKENVNTNAPLQTQISSSNLSSTEPYEQLFNPRIRIRTGTREFLIGHKSCVTITTKDGIKIGSNIAEIENDYLLLKKNKTKIYYKDIEKIRMFPVRRWFPILTGIVILPPIFWFASSKLANASSSNCKQQIKEIKVVNKYSEYLYGKDRCK